MPCAECGCMPNKHIDIGHFTCCDGDRKNCWACVRQNSTGRFASVVMGHNDSKFMIDRHFAVVK